MSQLTDEDHHFWRLTTSEVSSYLYLYDCRLPAKVTLRYSRGLRATVWLISCPSELSVFVHWISTTLFSRSGHPVSSWWTSIDLHARRACVAHEASAHIHDAKGKIEMPKRRMTPSTGGVDKLALW